MLHPAQDGCQCSESGIFAAGNPRHPNKCVQFVDGAVSFYPQRILRNSLAAHQAGFARVSTLGVDTVQGDTWLIEWCSAHISMEEQKGSTKGKHKREAQTGSTKLSHGTQR